MASHLLPTTQLIDLFVGKEMDIEEEIGHPIREVRLGDLESLLLTGSTSVPPCWREILEHLLPTEEDEDADNVVWLTPNVFLACCGDARRRDFIPHGDKLDAVDFAGIWWLHLRRSIIYIFSRLTTDDSDDYQLVEAGEADLILESILRCAVSDPEIDSLALGRHVDDDFLALCVSRLGAARLRSIFVPTPTLRRIAITDGWEPPMFSEDDMRYILTHCNKDLELQIHLRDFGRALVDLLPAGQVPPKMVLLSTDGPFYSDGNGCEATASYMDALDALAASNAVEDLSIQGRSPIDQLPWSYFALPAAAATTLVAYLPPSLLTLRLPESRSQFSLEEWESLWTEIGAHPSLKRVVIPEGTELPEGVVIPLLARELPEGGVLRTRVMAQCLRRSCTLIDVNLVALGPWGVDGDTFRREVEPILERNRNRTPLDVFHASLENPRFRRHPAVFMSRVYPLLTQNVAVWLPRLGGPAVAASAPGDVDVARSAAPGMEPGQPLVPAAGLGGGDRRPPPAAAVGLRGGSVGSGGLRSASGGNIRTGHDERPTR
jgi:hypothetical protein